MKIKTIKLTDIKPTKYNPRQISDSDKTKLKNSLKTFGLVDPIIINLKNNNIIGGHQRYDALLDNFMEENSFNETLQLLELGDVGWVFTDEDLKIESPDHEKALNLALNKISGEWNNKKLNTLLEELELAPIDITLTGFDELDLTEINIETNIQYEETDFNEKNLEDLYEPPVYNQRICPKCGHTDEVEKFKLIKSNKKTEEGDI